MPNQRFPNIEIVSFGSSSSSQQHEMRFILSKTDCSMANTLRRIMIAEVPTLAIDLVEFHDNSSCLNDEYIAHRLGLIPLRYTPNATNNDGNNSTTTASMGIGDGTLAAVAVDPQVSAFVPHRECVCYERCPQCSVELMLDVSFAERQGLRSEEELLTPLTVTSKDLVSNNPHVSPAHFVSQDEQDESQDEGIAIVKLGPGQKLKLKAIARLGISKEHAKWCPVAVCTYKFWPEIVINTEQVATLTMEQKQALVDVCPDRILALDNVTGGIVAVDDAWDRATFTEDLDHYQQSIKKRPEDDDFVTVTPSLEKFIFTVESTGAMDVYEIVSSALRVLKDKLTYLAQEVENLKDM